MKKSRDIEIPGFLSEGLNLIRRLVGILKEYPQLEYIPIFENSFPVSIRDIWIENIPDGYCDKTALSKFYFSGDCCVEAKFGILSGDRDSDWNIIKIVISWLGMGANKQSIEIAGDDVRKVLLANSLGLINCSDKNLYTEASLARLRAAEIIKNITGAIDESNKPLVLSAIHSDNKIDPAQYL